MIGRIVALLLAAAFPAQAAAEASAACTGTSLVTEIQRETPEVWRAALADFAAVPNGEGLFWAIEKEGVPRSFLLGTMHTADAGTMKPAVVDSFAEARTVAVESTEIFDGAERARLAAALMQKARLADGTIDAGFSGADRDALAALTQAHGIPYFAARRLKPWFLAVLLAMPPCAKIAIAQGDPPLDEHLYRAALSAGKEVVGLETADEQMRALETLERAVQPKMLLDYARLGLERIEDWYATLTELYAQERPSLLVALMPHVPELAAQARALQQSDEALVSGRNRVMRDRLAPILAEGGAFVAVGALHLSGEDGLVELLRRDGYAVMRVR
jgi:uncharacterized protein YbaP (TraB family)